MSGDPGPYVEPNGPGVWVPRTLPYLRAREIAKEANEYGDKLHYLGKVDALLMGFVRDCRCEEECELMYPYDEDTGEAVKTGDRTCYVPAWAFEVVEP